MRSKRIWGVLLTCVLIFSYAVIPAGAVETPSNDVSILRISERLEQSIAANTLVTLDEWISLAKGDTVKYDCTYTPRSASLDFGVIDSSGVFHYINRTNGSINQAIEITKNGQYTLAIRNNASYAVTVTGTVKY